MPILCTFSYDAYKVILRKVNKIPGPGNFPSCVPWPAYFMLKPFEFMAMLLEVVDSFYLIFTGDLMENPLEKSLKLYVSYSGLLKGMFAEILIGEGLE